MAPRFGLKGDGNRFGVMIATGPRGGQRPGPTEKGPDDRPLFTFNGGRLEAGLDLAPGGVLDVEVLALVHGGPVGEVVEFVLCDCLRLLGDAQQDREVVATAEVVVRGVEVEINAGAAGAVNGRAYQMGVLGIPPVGVGIGAGAAAARGVGGVARGV